MNKTIAVGDEVWLLDRSHYAQKSQRPPQPYKVAKVGRKYFSVESDVRNIKDRQFELETLCERVGPNDNGHYAWKAYRFLEEWERETEEVTMRSAIQHFFRAWGWKLEPDQMRAVYAIVKNAEQP